ncbi:peptidase [Pseudomonas sp. 382]|uniref:peptidase n=1 Tax=Pseudomonas sp. 382 TaxID=1751969 RepID=UPI000C181375|nr:peptidase [Pseudomonas sp. 382]PIK76377.1 peptidase [Pseudomonas sp. 382]
MIDAVDTATTTASGTESATSQAVTTEQQPAATEQGQQQAQQQQQEQAAKPAPPEAYAFSSLPEGYSISEEQLAAFSPVLKELGLTQEQADKLVAFDAQRSLAAQEASQQQAVEFRNKQVGEWETALRSDAVFGGANFDANVAVAQQFLTDFGSPELSAFLAESGLGSHPEVVRMFHKAGKELGEGKLHRTTTEVPKAEMTIVDAFK